MKKVKLNVVAKDLDGKPVTEVNESGTTKDIVISNFIANSLLRDGTTKDPVRQMDLALKIHKAKGEIELEDADCKIIKNVIKNCGAACVLRAQVLKILEIKV